MVNSVLAVVDEPIPRTPAETCQPRTRIYLAFHTFDRARQTQCIDGEQGTADQQQIVWPMHLDLHARLDVDIGICQESWLESWRTGWYKSEMGKSGVEPVDSTVC